MITPPEFSTELFALHDKPLACYLEPEGYMEINRLKRRSQQHYDKWLPRTFDAARQLFCSIARYDIWGEQYRSNCAGSYVQVPNWREENARSSYPGKNGKTRPGKPLHYMDIIRSLSWNNKYSLGLTDKHNDLFEYGHFGNQPLHTTKVNQLCLDVDMDDAWITKAIAPIQRELHIERRIADALHLPYRVFRTGNRGHQVVMPFPESIDRSVASWLLWSYLQILRPYHYQDESGAHADKHNLEGLVRVAGGRHAKTGNLALWLNPDDASVYSIEEQMSLLRKGYRHAQVSDIERESSFDAAEEIAIYMEAKGYDRHWWPGASFMAIIGPKVVAALPNNIFVERFRAAREEFRVWDHALFCKEPSIVFDHDSQQAPPKLAPINTARSKLSRSPFRAQDVWDMEWHVGTWWDWISEGGHQGLSAAITLYGYESALQKLLDRNEEVLASGLVQNSVARDRERKITALWQMYDPSKRRATLHPQAVIDDLSDEGSALLKIILDQMHQTKKIQQRNRNDIEAVITRLLVALELDACAAEPRGVITLSLDAICDSIHFIDSSSEIDRSTVDRHIKRVTQGSTTCGFALVAALPSCRRWTGAARFRAGADLIKTPWGATLPLPQDDYLFGEVPTKQLRVQYRTATGGRRVEIVDPPKRRGRKRLSDLIVTSELSDQSNFIKGARLDSANPL